MTDYSFAEGSPELARIRAQAQALRDQALQGSVTTKSGTFGIGRGVSRGANVAFLEEVKRRGGITRGEMMGITGNITRDDPLVRAQIEALSHNKADAKNAQDIQSIHLPSSSYESLIGDPSKLTHDFIAANYPKAPQTTTQQVQEVNRVMTMAPRTDAIDVLAPSLLPDTTPVSYIPTSAPPNNLIDSNAESGVTDSNVEGDVYIPETNEGEYTDDNAPGDVSIFGM